MLLYVVVQYHLPKPDRNEVLVEFVKAHPDMSLAEVGRQFNLTRERVRQILAADKKKKATE